MSEKTSPFLKGLISGVSVGVVLLVLCSVAIAVWMRNSAVNAKKGWNLVPVLVASADVMPGTRLTRAHLEPRTMPEQFVTSATVKPEQLGEVLGHPLRFVLPKGSMLTWPRVELDGPAWFAKRDLAAGAAFDANDFEARRVPAETFTVWSVREDQFEQLKGTTYERAVRSGAQLTLSDVAAMKP